MEPYPANFDVDYAEGTRNQWLGAAGVFWYFKQLLLIPHGIILFFLWIGAAFGAWFGYIFVLITGKRLPDGLHNFLSGTIGWNTRTYAWQFSLVDEYPPFELEPSGYPAEWTESDDNPERNRLLGLAGVLFPIKLLLALPHLIILSVLGVAGFLAAWVGFWIIVFTGTLPEGIHTFVAGVIQWGSRTGAWLLGLTDTYPPFTLE